MAQSRDSQSRRSNGGSRYPLLVGILIGVLVGLGAALGVAVYLNHQPSPFTTREAVPSKPDKPWENERPAPRAAAAPAASANSAPAGGAASAPVVGEKARFDFYRILPGNEQPAVNLGGKPGGPTREVYYLQVGAFHSPGDADDLKAKLALAGLEAQIQTAELADKTVWYRVRLGPLDNLDELGRVKATLKDNNFDSSVIKVAQPAAERKSPQ